MLKQISSSTLCALTLLFVTASMGGCEQQTIRDRIAERRSPGAEQTESVSGIRQVNVGGEDRSFRLYVPDYKPDSGYSLLFAFHGFGSNGREQEIVGAMHPLADRDGVIVVYPEGISRGRNQYWRTQADQDREAESDFVRAMLTDVKEDFDIDTNRIFATGISNGGGVASMLASNMADIFAAIAPVAGAYYNHTDFTPVEPVAVMAFHGTADRIVPIKGRGKLPDIEDWSRYWAHANGCSAMMSTVRKNSQLNWRKWDDCDAPVHFISIRGEGHAWPGSPYSRKSKSDVDVTKMMFRFFHENPKSNK